MSHGDFAFHMRLDGDRSCIIISVYILGMNIYAESLRMDGTFTCIFAFVQNSLPHTGILLGESSNM